MTRDLTLSRAAIKYGGTLAAPDCKFSAVSTDSRTIQPGDLFVALCGERFDGHAYLNEVQDKACGLVVQHYARQLALPQWVVEDTTKALGQLAALKREEFSGPVIAITGSSGKTTVKEMVAAILSEKGSVLATHGNLNNHIGVPQTLFRLEPEHQFAVIEMGASAIGEIAYLCAMASPDIVLINNVLPAHVAGFGSVDGIARAKGEIYEGVNSSGTAVINIDEQYRNDWIASCATKTLLTFSMQEKADFNAADLQPTASGCFEFILKTPAGKCPVKLAVPGKHNVANALAASACAYAAGASLEQIASGLASLKSLNSRMQTLPGKNGATVIDDSYNANPGSMAAAINTLCSMPGEAILAMGDMAELGSEAELLHGEVGRYARHNGVQKLFAVGPLGREAVKEFGEGASHFETWQALAKALLPVMQQETVVLVKGSRSAGMERVVAVITENPDQKGGK